MGAAVSDLPLDLACNTVRPGDLVPCENRQDGSGFRERTRPVVEIGDLVCGYGIVVGADKIRRLD